MKIINASVTIMRPNLYNPDTVMEMYQTIEEIGKTCYKSKLAEEDEGTKAFIRRLIRNGHEAMLEHVHMTVRFIVDRGISHEIVRHRVASFAQESTRYCNYSLGKFNNEITVIEPVFFKDIPSKDKAALLQISRMYDFVLNHLVSWVDPRDSYMQELQKIDLNDHYTAYIKWCDACQLAECLYFEMLKSGKKPEEARDVLPTSLKTELVMTANMREWRHFFKLRAAGETGKPHPQMLEVAVPLLKECRTLMPELFDDIQPMEVTKDDER